MDRNHNLFGGPVVEGNSERLLLKRQQMNQQAYLLDEVRRPIVLKAIAQVCEHRGWKLLAAHVRTTHVHVVAEANVKPESVLQTFKSYVSRALNEHAADSVDRKRWARHGSTRWLFADQDVQEAIRYVVHGQGNQMEVFLAELL